MRAADTGAESRRRQVRAEKCSERVCGIVEEGSTHKKQKRGGGALSWLQVGSKPGLETVQGLGYHYFLEQAVSFGLGGWE